jgi:hypothetical protein
MTHKESPAQPAYSFKLRSGRQVWLDAFHFEKTYSGLMAGYPKNQMGYIWEQAKKAQTMWGADASFIIPPVTIIRENGGRKYESWPWYCYKVWLRSENINPQDAYSQLIVIWFAEEATGLNITAMVEAACLDVPWEQHATGWNF